MRSYISISILLLIFSLKMQDQRWARTLYSCSDHQMPIKMFWELTSSTGFMLGSLFCSRSRRWLSRHLSGLARVVLGLICQITFLLVLLTIYRFNVNLTLLCIVQKKLEFLTDIVSVLLEIIFIQLHKHNTWAIKSVQFISQLSLCKMFCHVNI